MSIIKLGVRALKSNFMRLDFPYKLTFIVTDKCNSRCKICNIWKRECEDELSLEEIEKFFSKSNKFSWIDISGGEIFLRKDIIDIIEVIFRNCRDLYLLHFPTNGLLPELIEKRVLQIMGLKPKRLIITVSLDGPPELHNKLRGVLGGWEKSVETFRRLRKIKGVEVYFGMTLSSHNLHKFRDTYKSVKGVLGNVTYKDFHINVAHSSEHYYGTKLKQPSTKQIMGQLKKFAKLRGITCSPVFFLESRYLKLVERFLETKKTPLPCKAMASSCFINSKGDVFPCSHWNKKLGNLREHGYDLKKIWNLKKSKQLLRKIEKGNCAHCWTPCEAYQTILGSLFNKDVYF